MKNTTEETDPTAPYRILPNESMKKPSPPIPQIGLPLEVKPAPALQKATRSPPVSNLSDFREVPASVQGAKADCVTDGGGLSSPLFPRCGRRDDVAEKSGQRPFYGLGYQTWPR